MTDPIVHILLCHSLEQPGAVTVSGWNERTFAKDVNQAIFSRLNYHHVNAWLHEQSTLDRRIRVLKKAWRQGGRQLAVEVHFNSFPQEKTRGFMTLANSRSKYGMRLARFLHDEVGKLRPDAPDLGVCGCNGELRFAGTEKEFPKTRLALLEDAPQWSCIPEPATLSNPEDADWITKFDNRRNLGYAIGNGILGFVHSLTSEVVNGC